MLELLINIIKSIINAFIIKVVNNNQNSNESNKIDNNNNKIDNNELSNNYSVNKQLPDFKGYLKCKCCGLYIDNPLRNQLLTLIREKLIQKNYLSDKDKFWLNDICRCEVHNKAVKGEKGSFHLPKNGCKAADIAIIRDDGVYEKMLNCNSDELAQVVEEAMQELGIKGGIGIYNTMVHCDVRGYNARWDARKK